jgi:rhodanese-related sulfurtransferase
MSRKTIDQLLGEARERLERIDPSRAHAELGSGRAVLIDIRSDSQIDADGHVPGSMRIQRNVLEWRLDPDCPYRHAEAPSTSEQVIVMCNEGYQSSLAAVMLKELGFERATDLIGGFQAWQAEGLPVQPPLSEASRLP